MFDFFTRRREEREQQRVTLAAVAEALRDAARAREAEAARTEALLAELRDQRNRDQEAFLDTLRSIGEQNVKVIEAVTTATAAQATAISDHLSLFKVDRAPEGRTVRDEDEYRMEVGRLQDLGQLPEEDLAALLQIEQGLVTDLS